MTNQIEVHIPTSYHGTVAPMVQWCRDNIGTDVHHFRTGSDRDDRLWWCEDGGLIVDAADFSKAYFLVMFNFKHAEDAMGFKLAWI